MLCEDRLFAQPERAGQNLVLVLLLVLVLVLVLEISAFRE